MRCVMKRNDMIISKPPTKYNIINLIKLLKGINKEILIIINKELQIGKYLLILII